MTKIELKNLSLGIDGIRILSEINLTLRAGEMVALIGPNGVGKSSLIKCALGAITPTSGRAKIGDEDAATMDATIRARLVAYLPQIRPTAWPLIVEDIVALGRYAYGVTMSPSTDDDGRAVAEALAACGLDHLRRRRADTLSGGELARTHCARAFAAQAPFLLADEPTNSLDPAGQVDIMRLIRAHVADGAGALVILHDINMAAAFADRIIWMKDGEIAADGAPRETISAGRMNEIFAVKAKVHEIDGAPSVTYED